MQNCNHIHLTLSHNKLLQNSDTNKIQDENNSSKMEFTLSLPDWAIEEQKKMPAYFPTVESRMKEVIRLSRLNFERGTGGPFAAGIFERDTGKLIVIGVNRVVPSKCSSAHAEVMTISCAQKILDTFDLGSTRLPVYQLVVNWRPCVMCFGGYTLVRCTISCHCWEWSRTRTDHWI